MSARISQLALLVRDYDEAIRFFTRAIGNQSGGRVFLFIETDDFGRDFARMQADGVRFTEQPRHEKYGTVVVFLDLYGNRWDLIERIPAGCTAKRDEG